MIWNHLNKNPSQKFCKNLIKLGKPQIFLQTLKVRSRKMKCMIKEWKRIIPKKGSDLKTEERTGKWFGVRERCLGRWEDEFYREKSRRNERNVAWTLYIKILVSRRIERCQELSRIKIARISYQAAIEELSRGVHSKRGLMDQASIEHTETSSMDQVAVKKLSRLNLKNLDGSRLR